ncbi:GAF modulated sigma54 specific transcriptional regulator, Fis family protein [Minicystis rosea]|nr:GAF modulated sigma54 specific transcriptional regulator, Fis family protein [Minicystis rosea]
MGNELTERTPSVDRSRGARIERYLFLVIEGARLDAGGLRVALRGTESLRIGRGETRALLQGEAGARSLEVPDARMSGTHARVVREGGAFRVEDAGSTNGTVVNGDPISSHVLRDGDVIELGQTLFLYRELEEEASASARDLDPSAAAPRERGLATLVPELARRLDRLARLAPTPLSIVLLGETGTGKEVLARAIHALSQRPGPFVAVNCGAIPQNLVESHLFGHVRGAFSGALRDEPGLVRSAQYGTLLLDEIGDLPASAQATLLRVLQEGEVMPVGSARTASVDVRVIAATHRPLEELVERGEFRRDLYARLAGYTFTLAPLRERIADLGLLVAALLSSGKIGAPNGLRLHRRAARALLLHEWPMNVRELEQCLRAASALAEDGQITAEDLPAPIAAALDAAEVADDDTPDAQDEQLRRELLVQLADAKGNVSEVARAMGKARQQIQRWMRRFAIDPGAYRGK